MISEILPVLFINIYALLTEMIEINLEVCHDGFSML